MSKLLSVATIKADDLENGEVITISVEQITDEDGIRWDLVASNGNGVYQGGNMTKEQAINAVSAVWGNWNTFKHITGIEFVGLAWGSLLECEKEFLLNRADAIDGRTGNKPNEDGDCIVDFRDFIVSISGKTIDNEITVADDAIFYASID